MQEVKNEVMTVQEVAEYLRLSEMTIYRLAQESRIPGLKIGRSWRFKKELIDEWFRHQGEVTMSEGSAVNNSDKSKP